MAEQAKEVAKAVTNVQVLDRMIKARKGREVRNAKVAELSPEERHGLRLVSSARKTLDIVESQIIKGKGCTPECLKACAMLQAASVDGLYD